MSDFTFKDYKYEDLNITGAFKNKSFIGQMELVDKYIHLDFIGNIDLNNPVTEFDFSMEIKNAFLSKIGFLDNHSEGLVSFKTYLSGFGNNWTDFSGFANMEDIVFMKDGETYNFGNIYFDSQSNNYNHILNFNSDFASFNILGDFKFDQLTKDLKYLYATVFPNLLEPSDYLPSKQHVDFDLEIRDFSNISAVFFPSLYIEKASNLRFSYNGEKEILDFSLNSNKVQFNDFILKNLNLNFKDSKDIYLDSNLRFYFSVDEIINKQIVNFQNIELQTAAKNNIVNAHLTWNNNDSTSLGKLSSIIDFKSSNMILRVLKSFIYLIILLVIGICKISLL